MGLEVVREFSRIMHHCQDGFLQRQVTNFNFVKRFAHIINWPLYFIFYPYQYQTDCMRGYDNIGKMDFFLLESRHNGWPRKIILQLLKSEGTFLIPFKSFSLVQKLEKWPTSICGLRDESVQDCGHSNKLLHFFGILRRL